MSIDPLSVAIGAALWPAVIGVRKAADRYGWHMPSRIIPPPRVGRWQIVTMPPYPIARISRPRIVGRYRMQWTARLIARTLTRRFPDSPPYQVRPVATGIGPKEKP